jgi:hypothetical protein
MTAREVARALLATLRERAGTPDMTTILCQGQNTLTGGTCLATATHVVVYDTGRPDDGPIPLAMCTDCADAHGESPGVVSVTPFDDEEPSQ